MLTIDQPVKIDAGCYTTQLPIMTTKILVLCTPDKPPIFHDIFYDIQDLLLVLFGIEAADVTFDSVYLQNMWFNCILLTTKYDSLRWLWYLKAQNRALPMIFGFSSSSGDSNCLDRIGIMVYLPKNFINHVQAGNIILYYLY